MKLIEPSYLEDIYNTIKEQRLDGRWIKLSNLKPIFKTLNLNIESEVLGFSEENRPIYKLKLGSGAKKILIWSQMHGNESTGTKAVFDFLNYFKIESKSGIVQSILKNCTISIIPMLNPDGAEAYTRVNANKIDLNRDAVTRKAKESNLLRDFLEEFNPSFCFNLHDQRTIFGVEGTDKPATISFLAPSEEETRKITNGRIETMHVITVMNSLLQKVIPSHIGRYTDEFYPTATGDNFQKLGYNTILIEAGHYFNDYKREEVRKFNFYALLQGVYHVALETNFSSKLYKEYFSIPNNQKNFYDVIHRAENNEKDIAFQYAESIKEGTFVLSLEKIKEGDLTNYLAHKEISIKS